jgi:hypothetical protein
VLDRNILNRIKRLDRRALRELRSHIDGLIGPAVVYQQKSSRCGCEKCKSDGPGHGLYWYAYFTYGGKTRCVYIGKEFREIDPIRELKKKEKQQSKKGRE